jgi:all-trans-retinol 13,14-reductase
MNRYDAAIIGAGLGGLQCAYILAKRGMKVVVVEKGQLLGGCIQTFTRRGRKFDTGFHYVGGLDDGQPLHRLFKEFGLMDLPWVRLDEKGFDEVVYGGRSYMIPSGFDNFRQSMKDGFPGSAAEIDTYTDFLKGVAEGVFGSFDRAGDGNLSEQSLFSRGAYDFLTSTIHDTTLQNVLSGTSPKLSLQKDTLPLYTFAQINASFILSAYRLRGGGMQVADSLAASIRKFGGEIITNAEVTKLVENNGVVDTLEIAGHEPLQANTIIADIHPAQLVRMAAETSFVRNIFKKRILALKNSFGMFTVNVALKPNAVKYLNRNIYIHNTDDVWSEGEQLASEQPRCCLISFGVPERVGDEYTTNVDLLTPMQWSDVEQFAGSQVMRRPDAYNELKDRKAAQLIDIANNYIPGLKDAVEHIYTSTPLTYADYTGVEQGSAYGVNKDYNRLAYTLLTPLSPIPNVFFTGQNLSLHGILGVSMTSLFTCAAALKEKPGFGLFGE